MIIEIATAVQETCEGHGCQFYKLQSLHVQYHRIFSASRVIMTTKDDHFVRRDQGGCLCLDGERELYWHDGPVIISHIILLYSIDPSAALVATENVDIAIFEYHGWHRTSFLVQLCYLFPSIKVN